MLNGCKCRGRVVKWLVVTKGSWLLAICRGELSAVIPQLVNEACENGCEELKKCRLPLPRQSCDS